MIHSKKLKIDYDNFPTPLIVSSNPTVDFLVTITKVKVVYLNPESKNDLFDEFMSTKQIIDYNQKFNSSFQIPVKRNGKIEIEIVIMSDSEGVDDFIIT
jgi:hypothetical protein